MPPPRTELTYDTPLQDLSEYVSSQMTLEAIMNAETVRTLLLKRPASTAL
jgi:hypothetical protein